MTEETWFFLLTRVKNYRSANLVACNQFISGSFPRKRTGLGIVGGMKGKVSGQSRAAKVRAAEDQGGKPLGSLRPGDQRPSSLGAESPKRGRASPLF